MNFYYDNGWLHCLKVSMQLATPEYNLIYFRQCCHKVAFSRPSQCIFRFVIFFLFILILFIFNFTVRTLLVGSRKPAVVVYWLSGNVSTVYQGHILFCLK